MRKRCVLISADGSHVLGVDNALLRWNGDEPLPRQTRIFGSMKDARAAKVSGFKPVEIAVKVRYLAGKRPVRRGVDPF